VAEDGPPRRFGWPGLGALVRPRSPWFVVTVVVVLAAAAGLTVALRADRSPDADPAGRAAGSGAPAGNSEPPPGAPAVPLPPEAAGRPASEQLEACVGVTLARLSLEERAGQVLMIGTPVDDIGRLADAVRVYHLGGVMLAGRSDLPATTLRTGVQALQRAAGDLPLQVGIDQEGGQVQTLRGADFPTIPTAVDQGRMSAAELRSLTGNWARRLAGIGVTIDLAPVADTVPAGTERDNPPIGGFKRQFGSTPEQVAEAMAVLVPAIQEAGVLTTLKHFPGLGRVDANTDVSDRAVDSVATVDDPYLQPFVRGIEADSAAIMISSARYPKLDPETIAAFSVPIVTGLLRDRLGYRGLVISDDLGVAGAVKAVPLGERGVRFLRAGGDLVLTVRSSDAGTMHQAILAAARGSAEFDARLTEAARQVIRSKYRAGLLTCG